MQMLPTVLPAAILLISAGLLIIFYRAIRQRRHSATSPLPAMGGGRVPGQALLWKESTRWTRRSGLPRPAAWLSSPCL